MSVRITFLGTGAGGSIHRAHTAIALECEDDTRFLLDASSGNTVARNCIQLGMAPESFHKVLLTHHHADHMSGLPLIQLVHTRSLEDGPPPGGLRTGGRAAPRRIPLPGAVSQPES